MKKLTIVFSLLFTFCFAVFSQIEQPVKWTFEKKYLTESSSELVFNAAIDNAWIVYGTEIAEGGPRATNIVFEKLQGVELDGNLEVHGKLKEKFEPNFSMDISYYENSVELVQEINITDKKNFLVEGYIEYMTCSGERCLLEKEPFSFGSTNENAVSLPNVINVAPVMGVPVVETVQHSEEEFKTSYWKPVIRQIKDFEDNGNKDGKTRSSWWLIFIKGFIGGLIAIFTPCVWPIIPMTVSFFLKRSKDKEKGKRNAVLYGVSIIAIYVLLGIIITLMFGAHALNSLSTSAFFNLLFFALLVVFGASFLGAFEITLPASWTTKIDRKAENTSGFASIFLMAFTLALVSFSCTGPIIGTLLVDVAVSGSILAPAIGMFGFAFALSIPFTFFALFPTWLQAIPKSGGWLNSVKVTLGFLELAFALKFLSVADLAYGWEILDREVFLVLWIVIFFMLGMYLIGKLRFAHDSELKTISVTRLSLSMLSFAFAIYMIPGLFGAPLKAISAFAPPLHTQDFNLYNGDVESHFYDYDEGMEYARKSNKPVLVDFTGHGCVNCRKMEASVWTAPEVKTLMSEEFVVISLYVDNKKPLEKELKIEENGKIYKLKTIGDKWSYLQRHKFGANAQPYYVILNNDGKPMTASLAFTEDVNEFLNFLKIGLEAYKNQ
jgi:thiol:disulfide interchange protein DsbD